MKSAVRFTLAKEKYTRFLGYTITARYKNTKLGENVWLFVFRRDGEDTVLAIFDDGTSSVVDGVIANALIEESTQIKE